MTQVETNKYSYQTALLCSKKFKFQTKRNQNIYIYIYQKEYILFYG